MSGYKLVPVEPAGLTDEQIFDIAEPFGAFEFGDAQGDKRLAFARAILAAAPAVQGEPVVWMYSYIGGTEVQTSKERWTGRDWKSYWEERPLYTTPQPTPTPSPVFQLGDHVRKTKGSQWKGLVVGTYSTTLTPEGYAVESDTEKGSVQIYPAGALELVGERLPC